ncbi:telomeric repeat-binding factor 1 [Hoplias malabaricus]|uniref:telomeric repeat-binding factor 1 n=1 Tax=Hoplias malabaricus TaxID=27720 RepID=UPI00346231BD
MCEAESLARCWMMDFCFRCVCSSFRDKNREGFSKNIKVYEAIVDSEDDLPDDQKTKRTICCFLNRIMDGNDFEVHYDRNDSVTPLMSAVMVWENLQSAAEDSALFENIRNLLFIQSVGVCLEKGNVKLAANALQWLEKEAPLPEKMQMKLSTVVKKKDVYDKLLTTFSYNRLLDDINNFLDNFLQKHPSDFILKAATKVVEGRQERVESEQEVAQPTLNSSEMHEASAEPSELHLRPKKKLFSMRQVDPWKPSTAKKLQRVPRTPVLKLSRLSFKSQKKQQSEQEHQRSPKNKGSLKNKGKRRWTWKEDSNLKSGVRQYGEGQWAKILQEYNFEGRTNVMLKDRWRTLKKMEES